MPRSQLYLSAFIEPLAERLDANLRAETGGDLFTPATVVVPNAATRSWLQLFLARRQSVAINLRIEYLESELWETLAALTTLSADLPIEELTHDHYRLLVLSILLEKKRDPDLAPILAYLGAARLESREYCCRLWDVADRLARLVRDYEFHRQNELIQKWLAGKLVFQNTPAKALESCQRALFLKIVEPAAGLRTRLSQQRHKLFKTLPQFANEAIESALREPAQWPGRLRERPVHVFGVSQLSAYHVRMLRWMGEHIALRVYHVNPLTPLLAPGKNAVTCATLRELSASAPAKATSVDALRQAWGAGAVAGFWRMSQLAPPRDADAVAVDVLTSPTDAQPRTVLRRLQADLFEPAGPTGERSPQDRSLQIVACPGLFREVETTYHSIIANLLRDKTLRQNEIAVMLTNVELYRPVVQSVFGRDLATAGGGRSESPIAFTFVGASGAQGSIFGRALLGMLDMALESFTRSSVLDVLVNPCVLARFDVEPGKADAWLGWTERLCVFRGWDDSSAARTERGPSRLYTWRLALQRLRLGRIMDTPTRGESASPHYAEVVPYVDFESGDLQNLDAFCRVVEGLMPRLAAFRDKPARGHEWAHRIRELIRDFLAIPDDRPEEERVCESVLRALELLEALDAASGEATLSLPLVREFLAAQLEELSASGGSRLRGGVSVGSLEALRPLPFKIVYILGLGEGLFPAPEPLSPFDLRNQRPEPGDIRSSDAQRLQFFEALAAAREKLYLFYNCKEVQKDEDLHPCSLLNTLRAYIESDILPRDASADAPRFKIEQVPLSPSDPRLFAAQTDGPTDVCVSYSRGQRQLAGAERGDADALIDVSVADASRGDAAIVAETPLNLRELRRCLNNPADAALKRHLRIESEDDAEPQDDEPFYTDFPGTRSLVQNALTQLVRNAPQQSAAPMPDFETEFAASYEACMRQGLAPSGAFAELDCQRIRGVLRDRVLMPASPVAELLTPPMRSVFCGPVRIGQTREPVGAQVAFPPLRLALRDASASCAVLSGVQDLFWADDTFVQTACFLIGGPKPSGEKLSSFLFDPVLFYLALLAGTEKNADGRTSAEWLSDRPLRVLLLHDQVCCTYTYAGIPRSDARAYLEQLAGDFLCPHCFDLLPAKPLLSDKGIAAAFESDAPEPDSFPELVEDVIRRDAESQERRGQRSVRLVDLLDLAVPADAFAKLRRRFRLLDLGPRGNREAAGPPPEKPKSPRGRKGRG